MRLMRTCSIWARSANSLTSNPSPGRGENVNCAAADKWLNGERKTTKGQEKEKAAFNADLAEAQKAAEELRYFAENARWLMERFPEGTYRDVIGLC